METVSLPQSFFNQTGIGVIIVNLHMRPVYINSLAAALFGIKSQDEKTRLRECERFLINNRPLLEQTADFYYKHTAYEKKVVIKEKGSDKRIILKVFYSIDEGGQICIFLLPLSNSEAGEISSPPQQEARSHTDNWQDQASKLFELSEEDLLLVNNQFKIDGANQSIMQQESIQHCYEYLGQSQPCPECPAKDKTLGQIERSSIGHHIAGEYLTETIVPYGDGSGAMLTFGNTTEKIALIEKIKSTEAKVRRKQLILSSLVELALYMQSDDKEENILHAFMEDMVRLTDAEWAIILADGERKGSLWMKVSCNAPAKLTNELAGIYLRQSLRETGFCILPPSGIEEIKNACEQLPLKHGKKQVGLMIVKGKLNQEHRQLMSLFAEPIELFITNRMLAKKLDNLSSRDSLTELYNRNYLSNVFEEETRKFHEHGIHFSYILCDLNGLKPVNDIYGYKAGDTLIKETAQILSLQIRNTDIVARLGSDEFCILAPNTKYEQANTLIRKIKDALKEITVNLNDKTNIPINVSMGASGSDVSPPDDMRKIADQEMYLDKEEFYKSHERYR